MKAFAKHAERLPTFLNIPGNPLYQAPSMKWRASSRLQMMLGCIVASSSAVQPLPFSHITWQPAFSAGTMSFE